MEIEKEAQVRNPRIEKRTLNKRRGENKYQEVNNSLIFYNYRKSWSQPQSEKETSVLKATH